MRFFFGSKTKTFLVFAGVFLTLELVSYYMFSQGFKGWSEALSKSSQILFLFLGLTSMAIVNGFKSYPPWLSNFIAGILGVVIGYAVLFLTVFVFTVMGVTSADMLSSSFFLLLTGLATHTSNKALKKVEGSVVNQESSHVYGKLIQGLMVLVIFSNFLTAFFSQ